MSKKDLATAYGASKKAKSGSVGEKLKARKNRELQKLETDHSNDPETLTIKKAMHKQQNPSLYSKGGKVNKHDKKYGKLFKDGSVPKWANEVLDNREEIDSRTPEQRKALAEHATTLANEQLKDMDMRMKSKMAKGDDVKRKKLEKKSHAPFVESSVIHPRLPEELEAHLPEDIEEQLMLAEEDEDRERMAKGGKAKPMTEAEKREGINQVKRSIRAETKYFEQKHKIGKVRPDMSGGQKRGPQGYPKYQEQAQNEKGIHTPVSGVTAFPKGKSQSEAGDMSSETYAGKPHRELRDHGKELHRKKLQEIKDFPAPKLKGLAEGGEIDHDEEMLDHAASIASAIMAKRRMANGGQVDIEENNEEMPNPFDELNEAALKENYDSDFEDLTQPDDSNEIDDPSEEAQENRLDKVSAIRRRMKKRSAITE